MAVSPADVDYGLSLLKARQESDRKFSRYYDGKFDLSFASRSFRESFGSWLREIGYNRCRGVVDALSDRTTVIGWEATKGGDALAKKAEEIWLRNRMDNRQNEVVREAYRCADGYVVVWPDEAVPNQARFYANHAHCMTVVYDEEYPDHIDFAVKAWKVERGPDKGRWRVTAYYPDFLYRYITINKPDGVPEKFNRLIPYEDDGQPEVANPLGEVPVVHFGNDADTGTFGTSELADVVPLQDGANKAIADQLVASEYAAYPQRVIIGIDEPEKDDQGRAINPFQPGMFRIWTMPGSSDGEQPVNVTQFEPADISKFIEVQDAWDTKIARVSRVPVHWLNQSGDFPSGESLKTAEAPFVSKVRDRQMSFTSPWSRVMALGLRIEGAGEDEVAAIKPKWMPAESRSEREKYEIAQMQRVVGVPEETIWAGLGFSVDEITKMREQKDQASRRQAEQFAQSFDRGQDPDREIA